MKKYITPNMKINMFQSIIETVDPVIASGVTDGYVSGLNRSDIQSKTRVNLEDMKEITKFTF